MVGERIYWKGANRIETGVVESEEGERYTVRLDNGKYVIVNKASAKHGYTD